MKKQAVNPYLPSYEYVPDGEPHLFGDRLYIFGSHDRFNGTTYCMNDYVCWSAPVDDLSDWRYEGVIYRKTQDPNNPEGTRSMYAPDVAQGPDGRYYLYYGLANDTKVGVAVCDSPAGAYEFLGSVRDKDGNLLGRREQDFMPFDPAVLVEGGRIFLYVGQGPKSAEEAETDRSRHFRDTVYFVELEQDMLTMKAEPVRMKIPNAAESAGTGFEGHEFFEASSIRKFDGKYYYIYSSVQSHELCWAVSEYPDRDFMYGGVLTSNGDVGCEGIPDPHKYGVKLEKKVRNYIGNNHGSVVKIGEQYYVFGHRQTNRSMYSRQGYAERIRFEDGKFLYTELTSSGLNEGPLRAEGTYDAGIACHLMSGEGCILCYRPTELDCLHPAFTQTGEDREENPDQYISNMRDGAQALYRYFDFRAYRPGALSVRVRGDAEGTLTVTCGEEGEVEYARIRIDALDRQQWADRCAEFHCPEEADTLCFRYAGRGYLDLRSFAFLP